MSKNIFITGTGTDVGKTYVSALIVKKLNDSGKSCAYYKAAMSGNVRDNDGSLIPGDALAVKEISGIAQPIVEMCPYVYESALSPHLASRIEGNPVRLDAVKESFENIVGKYDYITVEGSGGILCPLSFDDEKLWLEDIIKALNLSCLIIADAGLGTINSVVLTVRYMQSKGIPIKGIIFNRFVKGNVLHEDNLKMCEYMTDVKVIACVADKDTQLDIDDAVLESLYE